MSIKIVSEQKLTDAERSAVEYINRQIAIINLLSIEDIAEGAFVSNATVSRAIRKCGFSSFSEMKFRLSEESKEDSQVYEMNRVLSKSYVECMETIKSIDIPSVMEVVRQIRSANTVYLLSNGLTSLIANEFAIQLQCQKINVCSITDSEMMRKIDLLASENDLVIVLSVKNSTPELAIGAQLAKNVGAPVVSCCCTRGTALDGLSNIILYGHTQPIQPNQPFGGTSRIALMIITRTIVEYMANEGSQNGL